MNKPSKMSGLIGGFTVYEIPTTCRDCGTEFIGKAFAPADERKRWGYCEACQAIQDAPKLEPKRDLDLQPPRRIWEPD